VTVDVDGACVVCRSRVRAEPSCDVKTGDHSNCMFLHARRFRLIKYDCFARSLLLGIPIDTFASASESARRALAQAAGVRIGG
jgi:hypothetical protein